MKAKRKVMISLLAIVFVMLAIAGTIALAFALTQQNVTTYLNIGYTVQNIDGSVYATYKIGGVTEYLEPIADADHISADNKSLIFKSTDTENAGNLMFPEGQIPLTVENDNMVIQYTYSNTGDRHYIASMSFDAELKYDNMKVEYSINGVDYSTKRYAVVVPANTSNKSYWIRISIDNKAKNATFNGDFNWILNGCDEQEESYLSLTSLEFVGSDGSYSVAIVAGQTVDSDLEEMIFPSSVNGDPVTTIVESNLSHTDMEKVKSVYIPASVTNISYFAFSGFANLQSVTFEQNENSGPIFTYMNAFEGCKSLKNIYINDINKWAQSSFDMDYGSPFNYAENLYLNGNLVTDVVLDNTVTYIGDVFAKYTKLKSIEIPASVSDIVPGAFYGCTGLTNVDIAEGLTTIWAGAFLECTGLTSIEIPASVETISSFAFDGCTGLKNVNFDENCNVKLGTTVFSGCTLQNLTLPKGIIFEDETCELGLNALGLNVTDTLTINCKEFLLHQFTAKNVILNYSGDQEMGFMGSYQILESNIETLTIKESVKGLTDCAFVGTNIDNVVVEGGLNWIFECDLYDEATGYTESIQDIIQFSSTNYAENAQILLTPLDDFSNVVLRRDETLG